MALRRRSLSVAMVATAATAWLAGCSSEIEPIVACDAQGPARPLCGFRNPEDLVVLPGGRALLVSEYGDMQRAEEGAIVRLDLATERRTELFRAGDAGDARPTPGWGDPACPGAPASFSPHGIDLVRRTDGRDALLVVNHGGRESVEMFEVRDAGGAARLAWRGCAAATETAWLNDVVGLEDGGFLVSHMMPRRRGLAQLWELARVALFGVASGHVLAWSPERGFSVVPGSEAALANGIALSPDGETLFVNATLGDRVIGIERATGRVVGEAEVESPDNATWAEDGRLWVASLTGSTLEMQACAELERGACPTSFQIVAVDPRSFATEIVYASDGVTMGAGTVGLQVGGELFVGSFAGDRILRVALGGGDAP